MRTRRLSRASWVVASLLVTVLHRDARADAVGPAPEDCPAGSFGDSCHGGQFCRPSTCESDAACVGGETCQEVKVCVGGIQCGGGIETADDPPIPTFAGLCKDDGTCDGEASCQPLKQCVGAPDPTSGGTAGGTGGTAGSSGGDSASGTSGDTGSDKRGCAGCSTAGGPGAAALALLAFGQLLRRRRGARASR